jgi:hypothetical protein
MMANTNAVFVASSYQAAAAMDRKKNKKPHHSCTEGF